MRLTKEGFARRLNDGVLIFDGAMGSNLQTQGLNSADFDGKDGCSEALVLHAPHAIRKVHADFLAAGCHAVETNTFGATRMVLQEYGLENQVREINMTAVRLAREAIEAQGRGRPCFVGGSIGPTSRLPSLGQISFAEMSAAYAEQVESLWDAGVDLFLVETCQDILQTKAALLALTRQFRRQGQAAPVMVSVTIDPAGSMLAGSNIEAVLAILDPFDLVDAVGLNCSTGPTEMIRHVEYLARHCRKKVSVMPNAGFPENIGGKAVYRLSPNDFAAVQSRFVLELGVEIVGGCCGTTPEHLRAVVAAVDGRRPAARSPFLAPAAASLFQAVGLHQEPPPCVVGERTNANGSRVFRDFLLKDDWESMTGIGREQARGGAHILDLCVAFVGRREKADMERIMPLFARQVKLPVMIDSTAPEVVQAALECHGGRCLINSVNFEDGGARLRTLAQLARDYGAMLVCLAIDEEGMARSLERKMQIVRRLHQTLVTEFGFRSCDLIFDALTFSIGSGDKELYDSAVLTLAAVEQISREFPEAFTMLGVSNVSFGLKPEAREVLNSVFLHAAVDRGLKLAIVNPQGILPLHSIPGEKRSRALALLMNTSGTGSDLSSFLDLFAGESRKKTLDTVTMAPDQRLRYQILEGDKAGLAEVLERLRAQISPVAIINEHLIPAMRTVGELFSRGEMQLPFVLQSAEVMRHAVDQLEPFMEKRPVDPEKKIVLATVAGDVHDIGKNLVDILLANNGFTVFNLGIKIDIDTMIKAARENDARVIGMSGLLVKSTQIMKENLEELNRRNFLPVIILGGAALTRSFVEQELAPLYRGKVFYAQDAFDGLTLMQSLGKEDSNRTDGDSRPAESVTKPGCIGTPLADAAREDAPPGNCGDIPHPLSLGQTQILALTVDQILPFINKDLLFRGRWRYRRGHLSEMQHAKIIREQAQPALEYWLNEHVRSEIFQPKLVFGYFPCRSLGDSLKILDPQGNTVAVFSFPRSGRRGKICLADFFRSEADDMVALWAVTVGATCSAKTRELFQDGSYRDYWHLHGLAIECAEATADFLEDKMAVELGFSSPSPGGKRRGLRFSFGFPSCPDLSAQVPLLKLLQADRIGISLTETFQMVPEQSVSGVFLHHPDSHYFVP
jgi:5-methyltetrahydrofolate--homocysteine methyltransferase